MHGMPQAHRSDRRRFLVFAAAAVADALLAACSRGAAPTLPPAVSNRPAPSVFANPAAAPAVGASRPPGSTSTVGTPKPSSAAAAAPIRGIDQSVGTLNSQRLLISPLDPAWSYSHGPWARLPHPGWPTDQMVAVLSDAWARSGQVIKAGVGRRCAFATDSPFATLLATGDGRSFSASLNGGPPMRIGPLPTDGSRIELPLFEGRNGRTRIELTFDAIGANDGIYVAASGLACENGLLVDRTFNVPTGAPCPALPADSNGEKALPRLVVFGNGYAAGMGASAPGATGCAALIGERLGMEAIAQGWERTDVDVRSGEAGDPPNSGLDRVASDVIALKPDAILLIYGLQAAAAAAVPTWQYAYDYATLLRAIRTGLPGVPIFCSGIPSCSGGMSDAFLQPWNDAIRSATITVEDCPFIDAAGWWGLANYSGGGGPVYVSGDRVHPNDAGHKFLAVKYAATLAQRLS